MQLHCEIGFGFSAWTDLGRVELRCSLGSRLIGGLEQRSQVSRAIRRWLPRGDDDYIMVKDQFQYSMGFALVLSTEVKGFEVADAHDAVVGSTGADRVLLVHRGAKPWEISG